MERSFIVQNYSLKISNSTSSFSSVVVVHSELAEPHGIHTDADISFVSTLPGWATAGQAVGYVLDFDGFNPRVAALLLLHQFDEAIAMLRHERPVKFEYDARNHPDDPSGSTKLLNWAQLRTMSEPVGEGPVDKGPISFDFDNIIQIVSMRRMP
jgi:hypothetical protein